MYSSGLGGDQTKQKDNLTYILMIGHEHHNVALSQ